jgi:hypothetical protein
MFMTTISQKIKNNEREEDEECDVVSNFDYAYCCTLKVLLCVPSSSPSCDCHNDDNWEIISRMMALHELEMTMMMMNINGCFEYFQKTERFQGL